jgi:hypothetical protein
VQLYLYIYFSFLQYVHSYNHSFITFAEAHLHIFTAAGSEGGVCIGCRAKIRTLAGLPYKLQSQRTTIWAALHTVWAALHPNWAALHPIWASLHPNWAALHPVWAALHPIWVALHPLWAALHPNWAALHPLWAALHPIWAALHPNWAALHPSELRCTLLSCAAP